MADNLARVLDQRCLLALSLAATLVLFNEAIVQPSLLRLMTDAPLINVAGRQRMLSQRLAKAALIIERESGSARSRPLDELSSVLRIWSASQASLSAGRAGVLSIGANSPRVRNAFERIEPVFSRLKEAARSLVEEASKEVTNRDETRRSIGLILANEAEYLERMEQVVGFYEEESRQRVDELRMIGIVVTGLILVALFVIGRWILRPAVGLIRLQVAELRRARLELEDRVEERTRQLEEANARHLKLVEQLGHADRTTMIGEMASSLAHELNQPLGAIANYAEGCLIALKSPTPAIDEVTSAIERLLESTLRAGRIIGQVRRFVTRHGPNREWFDPNRTVGEVEEILAAEATRAGITVLVKPAPQLPLLWGDPTQIQQVLINLVRNAFESLRQSQVDGPKVIMRTEHDDDNGVIFEVEDNGEGIEPSKLNRVFDAYYSTRAEGMGMGLAICRSIVEAHQGQLQVKSDQGTRTVFQFILPVSGDDDAECDGLRRG
ncbi:MAG TPA: ATP-binding protein [Isosphaeraceae bacterium]|nr:ATP-binding protein [Isosphaeraceae bacterium]